MTEDNFITVARKVHLALPREEGYTYHIIRYKYFYDGSPKKGRCEYAIKSKELHIKSGEKDKLVNRLIELGMKELAEEVIKL